MRQRPARSPLSAASARGVGSQVTELRREHAILVEEYREARARVREYAVRSYLRAGERLEARTLERLSVHKRAALGDVGKRLGELESRLVPRAGAR